MSFLYPNGQPRPKLAIAQSKRCISGGKLQQRKNAYLRMPGSFFEESVLGAELNISNAISAFWMEKCSRHNQVQLQIWRGPHIKFKCRQRGKCFAAAMVHHCKQVGLVMMERDRFGVIRLKWRP